jgi:hypothetical protein
MGGNYSIGQKSPSQQTYRTGGTHTTQQVGNAIYEQGAIRCLKNGHPKNAISNGKCDDDPFELEMLEGSHEIHMTD